MDAVMTVLLQVVLLGILGIFFVLMALAIYAVAWFVWETVHGHHSVGEAWQHAVSRVMGAHR